MKINGILLRDGSDSETESSIPVLYINSLNKCLSLITGDAEDFMYKISEKMTLWPNLKYHVFGSKVINREMRVANINSLKAFLFSLKVKSEHDVVENDLIRM